MKDLEFVPIIPVNFSKYKAFWDVTPIHTSDYTLLNIWAWSEFYGLDWAFTNELCWIRQTRQQQRVSEPCFWAPIGNWLSVDWKHIPLLDKGMTMYRVPEQLCSILTAVFPNRVHIEETPEQWDYVYSVEELLSLKGRKFDSKRNHLNAYKKQYGEDYRDITVAVIPELINLTIEWCKWKDCSQSLSLKAESNIICTILDNWELFPDIKGGMLYNNSDVLAFSIGEVLDKETMVVHIEKGMHDIRGVYQAINNCFIKYECKGFTYVNREQDLGNEGLRKAKQSYHPISQLKKNKVIIYPQV